MRHAILLIAITSAACTPLGDVGRAPALTPAVGGEEYHAMMVPGLPRSLDRGGPGAAASLWDNGNQSLMGDRRASAKGDILTVVISIDDSATMTGSSQRARSGKQNMRVGALFGLPEKLEENAGVSLNPGVETSSSSQSDGSGTVKRKEKLTLRVAATVIEALPNGVLAIAGTQEVRVNDELRELLITGYVRPGDISRQNEITYDKIASARISYGGRGRISEIQQPRYGQQIADIVLPF